MSTTRLNNITIPDALSIRLIQDNFILSEDGSITVGYEIQFPVWGESSDSEITAMISSFKKALKALPDWTLVHRQDIYLKDKFSQSSPGNDSVQNNSVLRDQYFKHFRKKEFMSCHHRIFFTYNTIGPSKDTLRRGKLLRNHSGRLKAVDVPSKKRIDEFCQVTADFMSAAFKGNRKGDSYRELRREDYIGEGSSAGIIESYLSLSSGGSDSSLSFVSDLYSEDGDSISIDWKHMVGFCIASSSDLPSEIEDSVPFHGMQCSLGDSVHMGYSHPIGVCLEEEHIVNSYILKADQQSTRRSLGQKARRMQSMSSEMYNSEASLQIEKFLRLFESDDLLLVYHRSDILAWGKGEESEDAICQRVRAALSSMNICAEKIRKTLPEEFLNGIPGNEMNFSKDDYLLSEASAVLCLLGWESFDKGLPDGNLQVSERISSRPIKLDLCKEACSKGWINAYNAFVLGPTGSGKSFFMNHYLRCCHDKGAKICVLDNGKSYAGLSALIKEENGESKTKRKTQSGHEFEFNPFAGFLEQGKWLTGKDHLDLENPSVQFFLGIIKTICELEDGWTTVRSSVLSEYLKVFCMAYPRDTDPVFDDFYTCLIEINSNADGAEQLDQELLKELIISVHTYTSDGTHPKTLNSQNSENLLSDDFSVFEIGELLDSSDKTYCRLCLFSIIHSFDLMMRRDVDSFKVLVIEEAWKAISNKDMQPYLNSLWKTSRKYNTAAIVVTQQMSDIISSDIIKDTIIANSPVKIVLDQRECISELDAVSDILGLTETDKRYIRSLNTQNRNDSSKDVFLKIGQGKSGAYKIEVSQAEAFLYESVLKDKSELSDTISSGKSIISLLKRKRKI